MTLLRNLGLGLLLALGSALFMPAWANECRPVSPTFEADAVRLQVSNAIGITLPQAAEILGYETSETFLRLKLRTDFPGYVEIIGQLPLEAAIMSEEMRAELGEDAGWWDVSRYEDIIASKTVIGNKGKIILGLSAMVKPGPGGDILVYLLFQPG